LGRFFLAMADQQMLNSLAIMIATFAMWDEISVYTLWIAWALAVATLTTHLATMRLFPVYADPPPNTQTSLPPIPILPTHEFVVQLEKKTHDS
jgi:hypothetical protein